MLGKLTLVPTPIDDQSPLEPIARDLLMSASSIENSQKTLIVVEEHKACRRRWLNWGLPREAIDKFLLLNEHNAKAQSVELASKIKSGYQVFLMSDCGLPAFCDPGRDLVALCHQQKLKVTATPYCNSISLAIALSGFDHSKFLFRGFPPAKNPERSDELLFSLKTRDVVVLMDTPYRMVKMLDELQQLSQSNGIKRKAFLATNLNQQDEELYFGHLDKISQCVKGKKKEFILILG